MNKLLLTFFFLNISFIGISQALSLDSTFGVNGMAPARVTDLTSAAVQPDGRIVAATRGNPLHLGEVFALRYKTNGSLDSTFGQSGKVTFNIQWNLAVRNVLIQSDGKILIMCDRRGEFQATTAIIRLNPNGSVDNTFAANGLLIVLYGYATPTSGVYFGTYSIALQEDDKIILAGPDYLQPDNPYVIMRFNTNGSPDASFGNNGKKKIENPATSYIAFTANVLVQDDGKIIMVGSMLHEYVTMIVRCKQNGQYDSSFNGTGRVTNGQIGDVRAIAKQSNGNILLAAAKISATAMVRYNTNGTVDNSFGNSGYAITEYIASNSWSSLNSLQVQRDGKILTSSIYMRPTSNAYEAGALRYNPNGTLDNTFASNGKFLNIPTGSGLSLSPRNKRIYFWGSDSIAAYKSGIVFACENDNTPPAITCVPSITFKRFLRSYPVPQLKATDNCGIRSIRYIMSGATCRTGSGNDASGKLNKGITYLKWIVTDSAGNSSSCTTVIAVMHPRSHNVLNVGIFPNPSKNYFVVTVKSEDTKHKVLIRVFNFNGKAVEIKWMNAREPVQMGSNYAPGKYYFYFTQADQKAVIVAQKIE